MYPELTPDLLHDFQKLRAIVVGQPGVFELFDQLTQLVLIVSKENGDFHLGLPSFSELVIGPMLHDGIRLSTFGFGRDIDRRYKLIQILSRISGIAISFLQFPDKLLGVTISLTHIVDGQFSPTLTNAALQLMPFALDDVCNHARLLLNVVDSRRSMHERFHLRGAMN
jgi:hypothetical protein